MTVDDLHLAAGRMLLASRLLERSIDDPANSAEYLERARLAADAAGALLPSDLRELILEHLR